MSTIARKERLHRESSETAGECATRMFEAGWAVVVETHNSLAHVLFAIVPAGITGSAAELRAIARDALEGVDR